MLSNPVLGTIAKRSSIRAYADTPLTCEQLEALKLAVLASPTAVNAQAQRHLFITNPDVLADIEKAVVDKLLASGDQATIDRIAGRNYKVLYDAPLLVIVAIPADGTYYKVDAGIAAQSLALAAKSMGLDSVILGMPAMAFTGEGSEALREKTCFPAGLEYGIGVAIGHRAMDKDPHEYDMAHIIDVK